MTTVAILGLGAMGSRMARNLLAAGINTNIYNRTRQKAESLLEAGAHWGNTPREAVHNADIVISMVSDVPASEFVWLDKTVGAINAMQPGAIAVESSTLTVQWITQLGKHLGQSGIELVDAPVAGSRPQADAGQLVFLVGAATQALDTVAPLLDVLGARTLHLGPTGSGMKMKLAVNALFGIQVAGFGEILQWLRKQNVGTKQAAEILSLLPTTSPALKVVADQMATDNFAPLFPIDLVVKDFSYLLDTAALINMDLPTSKTVHDVFYNARDQGYGSQNISAVIQAFT